MNRKDILELKKRFKKEDCTFTKMCGCYVNGEKNIVLKFDETFLTLRDQELHKYLEIAKKVLSGTVGNNLLELEFPMSEESAGGKQHSLMALKRSELKDEGLLDNFYKMIIDTYNYTGNFLIVLFHDAYDVIIKTKDNLKLDESEEVYEYILCAICPVELSKPGLGYFEDENRIGVRIRDWVVGAPDHGFVFPAFTDRSSDIHSVMYYSKNPKEPHAELMEECLGCSSKQTAAEKQETFHSIIRSAIGEDEDKSQEVIMDIQENLNNMVEEHKAVNGKTSEPIIVTPDVVQEVLSQSELPAEVSTQIEKSYKEEFGDMPPEAEVIIDTKALNANAKKKKEEKLEKQVQVLKNELEKVKEESEPSEDLIVVKVRPQKVSQIKSQIIDGQRCIIIPVDENEQASVNGVETLV